MTAGVTKPLTLTKKDGIYRFDNEAIQKAVDRALAAAPDRKVAVVAHADLEGTSLSLAVKLGDQWSIAAGAYKPWGGELAAEAEVVWSPF